MGLMAEEVQKRLLKDQRHHLRAYCRKPANGLPRRVLTPLSAPGPCGGQSSGISKTPSPRRSWPESSSQATTFWWIPAPRNSPSAKLRWSASGAVRWVSSRVDIEDRYVEVPAPPPGVPMQYAQAFRPPIQSMGPAQLSEGQSTGSPPSKGGSVRVRYVTSGRGPGRGAGARSWRSCLAVWGREHPPPGRGRIPFMHLDLPGHGKSDKPKSKSVTTP